MALQEYVIVDLETTGLSKERHKITEIAAVKVKDNNIVDKFETLVNPEEPIPPFITKLTGINDEMVQDSPTISEALPKFLDFLGDAVFVAHNASFDMGFITHNVQKHLQQQVKNDVLCTLQLARKLLPDLPNKKLKTLCSHFDVTNETAHRAMSDVKATYQVFTSMLDLMKEKGIQEHNDILTYPSSK